MNLPTSVKQLGGIIHDNEEVCETKPNSPEAVLSFVDKLVSMEVRAI